MIDTYFCVSSPETTKWIQFVVLVNIILELVQNNEYLVSIHLKFSMHNHCLYSNDKKGVLQQYHVTLRSSDY